MEENTHTRSWEMLLQRFQMVSPYLCPGLSGQRYFWSKPRVPVTLRHPNYNKSVLPGAKTTWICLKELLKNSSAGQDHWRWRVSNLHAWSLAKSPVILTDINYFLILSSNLQSFSFFRRLALASALQKGTWRGAIVYVLLSWPERLILFTELCLTMSLFLLNFMQKASPAPNTNQPCWMLHLNLQVLTAAVNKSGNGWQGDFLERWGHDGNRRLIHPELCNNNPAVTMTIQAESPGQGTAKLSATVICASSTFYTSLGGNQC